jgi:hypothetical protein
MNTASARDVFAEVVAIYGEDPSAWTQGTLARNDAGTPVDPLHPSARHFCALGLMMLIVGEPEPGKPPRISWLMAKLNPAARSMGWLTFFRLNDLGTLAQVVQCFRIALQAEIDGQPVVGVPPGGVYGAELSAATRRGDPNALSAAQHLFAPERAEAPLEQVLEGPLNTGDDEPPAWRPDGDTADEALGELVLV